MSSSKKVFPEKVDSCCIILFHLLQLMIRGRYFMRKNLFMMFISDFRLTREITEIIFVSPMNVIKIEMNGKLDLMHAFALI